MIVCKNSNCPYCGGGGLFCEREIPMMNQFGQCEIWFSKSGQPFGQAVPQEPRKTKVNPESC